MALQSKTKEFVQDFRKVGELHRKLRLAHEYALYGLRAIRKDLSPEEYAILHARLQIDMVSSPLSMPQIARALKKNGIRDTEVSRQRIDQIISKTLERLDV